MSSFQTGPKVVKAGLVLLPPPDSGEKPRVIPLQYNPDTLTRTLQVQGAGDGTGDRLETLRLKGPPVEAIKLEAELDAVDERGDARYPIFGVGLQLAALESIVSPTAAHLLLTQDLSRSGTLEIAPVEAPLTVFVWGRSRVMPVRITEFTVTEEFFDASLEPTRAKVALTLRVLSTSDFPPEHRGSTLYLAHQYRREILADLLQGTTASTDEVRALSSSIP